MFSEPSSFPCIRKALADPHAHIRFLGIGGVSVSSLARMAKRMGYTVSGYDVQASETTRALVRDGIPVTVSSRRTLPSDAALVVSSHAIRDSDPELTEAHRRGIPCVARSAFLGYCMQPYRHRIGISGTHGKSSTVAMAERLFLAARRRPTVFSGSKLPSGEAYLFGDRDIFLYEACEYRDSFLDFCPTTAVFLNLEWDHTDYFPNIQALCDSFVRAGNLATERVILNADDGHLCRVAERLTVPVVTFGGSPSADYRTILVGTEQGYPSFSLFCRGEAVGTFRLSVPGVFQIANAVAALAAAHEAGVPFDLMKHAMESYTGIDRRLEHIGTYRGRPVFYDYAHHPTEIAAGIRTLRAMTGGAVNVVFRPHTYSRTADLWDDFVAALSLADRVFLAEIFAAREEPLPDITSEHLAAEIGPKASFVPTAADALTALADTTGAIVLMGAGDLSELRTLLV